MILDFAHRDSLKQLICKWCNLCSVGLVRGQGEVWQAIPGVLAEASGESLIFLALTTWLSDDEACMQTCKGWMVGMRVGRCQAWTGERGKLHRTQNPSAVANLDLI